MRKPARVTILSNEFFDASLGRSGGFGWAAREAARCLRRNLGEKVLIDFWHGEPPGALAGGFASAHSDGFTVRAAIRSRSSRIRALMSRAPDLLLTIDYRPSFAATLAHYDRVPTVVWARDPRTPEDWHRIQSLRIPGITHQPLGVTAIDCRGLSTLNERRALPVAVAAKMPHLADKCEATYGLQASGVLPNPNLVTDFVRTTPRDSKPLVVFLGRLDPIKRPWLVIETARRLPHVDFAVAGKLQVGDGPGGWEPANVPSNVSFLGQVDGSEKQRLLQRAWLLMNTSIHEESPVSWLEALMYAVPVVSTVDSGDLVARFGAFVGEHLGDGMDAVPGLVTATEHLLEAGVRKSAGESGAELVRREHNDGAFLRALAGMARATGAASVSDVLS